MTKSRDLGNLAQTVAVNLPTALGTAGQSLVVNSGADGLEFGAASGGGGGFTKGTVSGNTIDLSTGNVFEYTPSANSTLTFSNAPTVHEFILKITGNSSGEEYDISSPTLIDSLDPLNNTEPRAFAFNNDGSKLFIGQGTVISQYSTNNYALAGATYEGQITPSQSEANITDLFFVDGSTLQVLGSGTDTIHEFTVDNGSYAVKDGLTYANKELVLSNHIDVNLTNPKSFTYNSDGSKLFVLCATTDDLFMVTLGTNYDPSSANAFVSTNRFDVAVKFGETNPIAGVYFNDDGSKIFVAGTVADRVNRGTYSSGNEYSMDPTDISFSSSTDIFNPDEMTNIYALRFVKGGKQMILSSASGLLYRYDTATTRYTISYPSSFKWPNKLTPSAPAKDTVDTYYVYTLDGGTTYYATRIGAGHE